MNTRTHWMSVALATALVFSLVLGGCAPREAMDDDAPEGTGAMSGSDAGMAEPDTSMEMTAPNLVELVAATDQLSSLLTVIQYVDANGSQPDSEDLSMVLAGGGPFTVFAPTNDAFDAALDLDNSGDFGTGDVVALEEALGSSEATADALYLVVANHAVGTQAMSGDLVDGMTLETIAAAATGDSGNFGLTVDLSGGVFVEPSYAPSGAQVVAADVEASNGVAHLIDFVLLDQATASALGLSDS